jgi:hypothetical protein
MRGLGAKKERLVRDWDAANMEKRSERCRFCGRRGRIELAHLAGREYDLSPALGYESIRLKRGSLFVAPSRVIPLCGPATDPQTCHALQEAGCIDLLPVLTDEEAIQAVADLGLHRAYQRLSGANG